MTSPTDRGNVVVRNEPDGSKTVMVCAGFQAGQPVDVFAIHSHVAAVQIHDGISVGPLPGGAYDGYTEGIAQVYRDDDGVVHVLPHGSGKGLLRG